MIKHSIAYANNWQFTVKSSKGSYFWDENNKQIIDFTSGWNVANLGWNHPEIAQAMHDQINKNVYVPMELGEEIQYEYAKLLINTLPKELNVVSRATGGTEANEQAIKIARAATGRKKIVGFYDSYHGESLGDISIGFRKNHIKKISPLVPHFLQMEYPTTYTSGLTEKETLGTFLSQLDELLKKRDVAAVVTEPGIITGWGSTYVAPQHFLSGIRNITQEYGTLLILDEVGTGFSRTGTLYGMHREGVIPDIVTFAKAISNGGAAIGAMVTKREIIEPVISDVFLISTFGWTPIACAAALSTLKIHVRDRMWEQSEEKGSWLKTQLIKNVGAHPKVGDIRGMGMELGLVFVNNRNDMQPDFAFVEKVCKVALKNNLYLMSGDEGSIQLMPPLTTSYSILEEAVAILVKSIEQAMHE